MTQSLITCKTHFFAILFSFFCFSQKPKTKESIKEVILQIPIIPILHLWLLLFLLVLLLVLMLPLLAQLLIIIIIIHRPISTSTRSGSCPRKKGRPCRHLDQAALLLLIVAANRRAEGVRFRESVRDWSSNREQGSTSWGAASLCLSAGTITVTHEREKDPETERNQSPFFFSLSKDPCFSSVRSFWFLGFAQKTQLSS